MRRTDQNSFYLLCGGAPDVVGVSVPERPERCAGKNKAFRYYLCLPYRRFPHTPERFEKIIKSEIAGGVTNAK